mgnify:CR=1 FL=1
MENYIDLEINGILIPHMKVMKPQYKGRCLRTGKWYDPAKESVTIAFKHRDQLTDQQKKALFGEGQVYHATTILVDQPQTKPKTWTPSQYQVNILDKLLNTTSHLFIEALAGCAKTATLVWLVKQMLQKGLLRGKQVIYLAFNKAIQEELIKELQGTGCPAMTTHGFGFQILKKQ